MAPPARRSHDAGSTTGRATGSATGRVTGRTAIPVDSPVFRFQHVGDVHPTRHPSTTTTSHQPYATVPVPRELQSGPWTADEHARFLHALELHGCGDAMSVVAAWHAIAATVATRSISDVQSHARRYYTQLQLVNTQRRKEYLAMQQIDGRWSRHQDTQLEHELASHIPARVSYPWHAIAQRVPGKTPRDARERYHKLCYDVSRIEAGQHVMMQLGRHGQGRGHGHNRSDSPTGIDCIVALTPLETQLLLAALEHVPVPSHAAPDVLAAVASGVAALACSKHRQPPRRVAPQFTADEASDALRLAIRAELCDPVDVLDLLASELRLRLQPQPQPQPQPQREPEPQPERTTTAAPKRRDPRRHAAESFEPSAATVYDAATARAGRFDRYDHNDHNDRYDRYDRDDARAGEALLTHLKMSPVHNPRRQSDTTRRRQRGAPVAMAVGGSAPAPALSSDFYDDDDVDDGRATAVAPLPSYAPSSFPYSLMPSAAASASAPVSVRYTDERDRWDPRYHPDDFMDDY